MAHVPLPKRVGMTELRNLTAWKGLDRYDPGHMTRTPEWKSAIRKGSVVWANIPVGPEHQIQSQRRINRPLTESGWPLALLPGQTSPGLLVPAAARIRKQSWTSLPTWGLWARGERAIHPTSMEFFFPRNSPSQVAPYSKQRGSHPTPPTHPLTGHSLSPAMLFSSSCLSLSHLRYTPLYIYSLTTSPPERKLPKKRILFLLLPAATPASRSTSGTQEGIHAELFH